MKTIVTLLAISFLSIAAPMASADEGDPDCEVDQPLIGYSSTMLVRQIIRQNNVPLYVCEGEHWDGQDTVQADQTAACPGPSSNLNPNDLFVGVCSAPNPNSPGDLEPAVRVSSANGNEVYTSTNIPAVGRAAAYVSTDSSGVYLRDNTPGNVLATAISAARITQGYPAESDCSQAVYQYGAFNPPSECGRDNTAITVEYDLIP